MLLVQGGSWILSISNQLSNRLAHPQYKNCTIAIDKISIMQIFPFNYASHRYVPLKPCVHLMFRLLLKDKNKNNEIFNFKLDWRVLAVESTRIRMVLIFLMLIHLLFMAQFLRFTGNCKKQFMEQKICYKIQSYDIWTQLNKEFFFLDHMLAQPII